MQQKTGSAEQKDRWRDFRPTGNQDNPKVMCIPEKDHDIENCDDWAANRVIDKDGK